MSRLAPSMRLPARRKADGRWTPVYEPGPVRRFLGFVYRCFGWLHWWV